ncbi:hypothetical protein HK102_004652 [Quaeritorhiza haematococci]|nr:hypothetical protein HK102_004652 [Quaeritorhiza haematococci]
MLEQAEACIDLRIFNQPQQSRATRAGRDRNVSSASTGSQASSDSLSAAAKKHRKFKRTVMAVNNIVSNKLYKERTSSLEAYFKDYWKISRAQVYRFLDCASVLKHLEDFEQQPTRERLCRSIKRLSKSRTDTRALWGSVLERVNYDGESVTSTLIEQVWGELLKEGTVTGMAEGMAVYANMRGGADGGLGSGQAGAGDGELLETGSFGGMGDGGVVAGSSRTAATPWASRTTRRGKARAGGTRSRKSRRGRTQQPAAYGDEDAWDAGVNSVEGGTRSLRNRIGPLSDEDEDAEGSPDPYGDGQGATAGAAGNGLGELSITPFGHEEAYARHGGQLQHPYHHAVHQLGQRTETGSSSSAFTHTGLVIPSQEQSSAYGMYDNSGWQGTGAHLHNTADQLLLSDQVGEEYGIRGAVSTGRDASGGGRYLAATADKERLAAAAAAVAAMTNGTANFTPYGHGSAQAQVPSMAMASATTAVDRFGYQSTPPNILQSQDHRRHSIPPIFNEQTQTWGYHSTYSQQASNIASSSPASAAQLLRLAQHQQQQSQVANRRFSAPDLYAAGVNRSAGSYDLLLHQRSSSTADVAQLGSQHTHTQRSPSFASMEKWSETPLDLQGAYTGNQQAASTAGSTQATDLSGISSLISSNFSNSLQNKGVGSAGTSSSSLAGLTNTNTGGGGTASWNSTASGSLYGHAAGGLANVGMYHQAATQQQHRLHQQQQIQSNKQLQYAVGAGTAFQQQQQQQTGFVKAENPQTTMSGTSQLFTTADGGHGLVNRTSRHLKTPSGSHQLQQWQQQQQQHTQQAVGIAPRFRAGFASLPMEDADKYSYSLQDSIGGPTNVVGSQTEHTINQEFDASVDTNAAVNQQEQKQQQNRPVWTRGAGSVAHHRPPGSATTPYSEFEEAMRTPLAETTTSTFTGGDLGSLEHPQQQKQPQADIFGNSLTSGPAGFSELSPQAMELASPPRVMQGVMSDGNGGSASMTSKPGTETATGEEEARFWRNFNQEELEVASALVGCDFGGAQFYQPVDPSGATTTVKATESESSAARTTPSNNGDAADSMTSAHLTAAENLVAFSVLGGGVNGNINDIADHPAHPQLQHSAQHNQHPPFHGHHSQCFTDPSSPIDGFHGLAAAAVDITDVPDQQQHSQSNTRSCTQSVEHQQGQVEGGDQTLLLPVSPTRVDSTVASEGSGIKPVSTTFALSGTSYAPTYESHMALQSSNRTNLPVNHHNHGDGLPQSAERTDAEIKHLPDGNGRDETEGDENGFVQINHLGVDAVASAAEETVLVAADF